MLEVARIKRQNESRMDVLFNTYRCPDHEREHLGLKESSPSTYLGQMIQTLSLIARNASPQLACHFALMLPKAPVARRNRGL